MKSLEDMFVVAQIMTVLAKRLTPEQRYETAAELRELPGFDEVNREFLNGVADSLEQAADEQREEEKRAPGVPPTPDIGGT